MRENKEKLQQEYKLRFSGLEKYRNNVWKILCSNFFQKLIPTNSSVLDLGSGYGEFINNIAAEKKYAMDLNPDSEKVLSDDINFINQDCSLDWPFDKENLDVIFSSNFLEHLYHKKHLEDTLKEAYKSLKKGGKIILIGPNIRFLPGEYWDFWDHHIAISDNSIEEVLKLQGFKVEKKVAKFLPYSMSSGGQAPLMFVKIYLKIPFLWRFFGKQFFVVAYK